MPLERRTPLRRRTRLRPRNPERLAELRDLQFGPYADYIRALPCCVCDRPGGADPHHVRSRARGGRWYDCVPLCRLCHRDLHHRGEQAFLKDHADIDFPRLMEGYLRRFFIEQIVAVPLREGLRALPKHEQFDPVPALLMVLTDAMTEQGETA